MYNQRMKLAIDCRMLGSGGIGSYLSALLPFFFNRYECYLIGRLKDLEIFQNNKNIKIIPCDINTFSLKELLCFSKEILKQINSCEAYYTPYCNIPSGIKIPIFSTIHDVVFLDIDGLSSKLGRFIRKCFYQRAINKSKIIFTVSNFSKERIQEKLHCKNTEMKVTYNALPHWFSSKKSNLIEKKDIVLFVGNIKKHKGLHTLLPAFKTATKPVDEGGFNLKAQLVIVGNAENFRTKDSSIMEEIDAMPREYVKFTGKISDEELFNLYSSARLLVQPSLYEGFGMPPLEALSLGTNVVISDIPVFQEIYEGFPVTFFKTENSNDLAKKIAETWLKSEPQNLPEKYSFEKTAQIIFENIDSKII